MLSEIKLSNIKSYKSEQSVPLNKLTLLFGPNGGGKSSVIQQIATLKKMLGVKSQYEDNFTPKRIDKKKEYKGSDIVKRHFRFNDFVYHSVLKKDEGFSFKIFRSDIELIISSLDFEVGIKLIEYSRECREIYETKWQPLTEEEATIFEFTRVATKNNSDDLEEFDSFELVQADFNHPYWFANLGELDYLLIKNIQEKIDRILKIISKKLLKNSEYDVDIVNQFHTIRLNSDSDFFRIENSILKSSLIREDVHTDNDNLDQLGEFRLDVFRYFKFITNISTDAFINFLLPLRPLLFGNHNPGGFYDITDLAYKNPYSSAKGSLEYIKRSHIVDPIRQIPKRLRFEDVNQYIVSDSDVYRVLFKHVYFDQNKGNWTKDPSLMVNNLLKIINPNVRLTSLDYRSIINSVGSEDREIALLKQLYVDLATQLFDYVSTIPHLLKSRKMGEYEYRFKIIHSLNLFLVKSLNLMKVDEKFNFTNYYNLSVESFTRFVQDKKFGDQSLNKEKLKVYIEELPNAMNSLKKMAVEFINNIKTDDNVFILENKDLLTDRTEFQNIYQSYKEFIDTDNQSLLNELSIELNNALEESFEYVLHDRISNKFVRFNETGTGFSQVFPIVINAALRNGKLICVEQPELHLHPGMQAKLAPMFIESIRDNHNQFILETHSEHLIKAVQLEVARHHNSGGKDGISKDDVSIVYISRDPKTGESVTKVMKLDESGSFIEPWPDDFFDSSSDLTFERLKLTHRN